jgi:hypothetical protein
MMEDLKLIDVIKKQKDRKKYYKSKTTIEDYGLGKLKRVQGYYAQIQMMMKKKFLPDLDNIITSSEKDENEKKRLIEFCKDNISFFNIFIIFSSSMHTAIQKELTLFVEQTLKKEK